MAESAVSDGEGDDYETHPEACYSGGGAGGCDPVRIPVAPAPLNGILKGGKLWRGGAAAAAAAAAGATVAPPAAPAGNPGGNASGSDATRLEKVPAVRFIHLNDTQADDDEEEASRCGVANSAFQQLFPRARKLIQVNPGGPLPMEFRLIEELLMCYRICPRRNCSG